VHILLDFPEIDPQKCETLSLGLSTLVKVVTGKLGSLIRIEDLMCSKATQGLFKRIDTKGRSTPAMQTPERFSAAAVKVTPSFFSASPWQQRRSSTQAFP